MLTKMDDWIFDHVVGPVTDWSLVAHGVTNWDIAKHSLKGFVGLYIVLSLTVMTITTLPWVSSVILVLVSLGMFYLEIRWGDWLIDLVKNGQREGTINPIRIVVLPMRIVILFGSLLFILTAIRRGFGEGEVPWPLGVILTFIMLTLLVMAYFISHTPRPPARKTKLQFSLQGI